MLTALLTLALGVAEPMVSPSSSFALIVGVNAGIDTELPALRYADDDAARYFELFRLLGARTYLLSRFDSNTQRLHPQAAAELREPTQHVLDAVVTELANDVAQARARGTRPILYVVYAGHGNVRAGVGYINLEDARLTGHDIATQVIDVIHADSTHMVVDACYSYMLAFSRGPGGDVSEARGFSHMSGLAERNDIGLVLSTSGARESHEWEALQAGIFSHEVRSGLFGPADVDNDGIVSYRELAAFVERANAGIDNERFRPKLFVRAPVTSGALLNIRAALERRLEVQPREHGHYFLEDVRGVRLADFHNDATQPVNVLLPPAPRLYLHHEGTDKEVVFSGDGVVRLALLTPRRPRVASRGAAHDAFEKLFALPFGFNDVARYQSPITGVSAITTNDITAAAAWRRPVGIAALATGGAATLAGLALTLRAVSIRDDAANNREAVSINKRIDDYNLAAGVSFGVGAASALVGVWALWWGEDAPGLIPQNNGAAINVNF